ncbi:putative entry exclusion protein TrbK-alt [Parasphingorhabdus sp.]|uniref:putative entry exclusion protein TrbK-alt n=1 Tax=Parasphingorhabdus sp. TaxID=2709688 RepID=UPI003D2CC03F
MKSFARIAVAAVLGIAVTLTLIQMQEDKSQSTQIVSIPLDETGADPVKTELRRCQALGAAGANDRRCLNAWTEMRSRFFLSNAKHNPRLAGENIAADVAPDAAPEPAADEVIAADETRPTQNEAN